MAPVADGIETNLVILRHRFSVGLDDADSDRRLTAAHDLVAAAKEIEAQLVGLVGKEDPVKPEALLARRSESDFERAVGPARELEFVVARGAAQIHVLREQSIILERHL